MGCPKLAEFTQGVGAAVGVHPKEWSILFLSEVLFCMDRWIKYEKFNIGGNYEKGQDAAVRKYTNWLLGYPADGQNTDVVAVVTRSKSAAGVSVGNPAPTIG